MVHLVAVMSHKQDHRDWERTKERREGWRKGEKDCATELPTYPSSTHPQNSAGSRQQWQAGEGGRNKWSQIKWRGHPMQGRLIDPQTHPRSCPFSSCARMARPRPLITASHLELAAELRLNNSWSSTSKDDECVRNHYIGLCYGCTIACLSPALTIIYICGTINIRWTFGQL